jgi:UDP-glucose 4-epimerase
LRILITGGTGFLGRAITLELISHGHDVSVLSRGILPVALPPEVRHIHADLTDRAATETVFENPVDAVIHLVGRTNARESFSDPVGYYSANVATTINLLSALRRTASSSEPAKVVFASTHAVYGSQTAGRVAESDLIQPESPYAASKVSAEQLIRFAADSGEIQAVVLRYFNIAGAIRGISDPDQSRIIPRIVRAAMADEEIRLNGGGRSQRDFVHVADAAAAARLAVEGVKPGAAQLYNVGTGQGTAVSSMVDEASAILGFEIRRRLLPPANEPEIVVADIKLITAELGWRPTERSAIGEIMSDVIAEWRRVGVTDET